MVEVPVAMSTPKASWSAQQQAVDTDQQVERAAFSSALQGADPGTYAAFQSANATALADAATGAKRAAFAKAYLDATRYADMDRNAAGYDQRAADVVALQRALAPESAVAAMRDDLATSRRQWEIDEWAFADKRDALFWLQLALIGLLACVVVAYGGRVGALSPAVARVAVVSVLAAVAVVGAYRYRFTRRVRDRRFWSRRVFPLDASGGAAAGAGGSCGADAAFTLDPTALLPASVTQCASQLSGGVVGLEATLTSEAAAAQSGAAAGASVCGVAV
jgi:hypothetical protein